MNRRMVMLIALVAVVSVMPANAETLEVRGDVVSIYASNPELVWDAYNFAAFWYDLDDDLQTEKLILMAGVLNGAAYDRTIDEDGLVYTTHAIYQEYELHENEGLTVKSGNPGGDTGYWIEGFMAEEYVAIDGNSDKLSKLLVEFEDGDKKTLATGEEWDLGGGFMLNVTGIDTAGEKATVQLSRNGNSLDSGYLDTSGSEQDRVYTYTADIGGENGVPVFSCYVNAIFSETSTVEIMYVFLIDDEVLEIDTGDEFGIMKATASSTKITLRNKEDELDLDTATKEHIMGNMYFKTADDDCAIRFYPMVEYTEPDTDTDGDGVPDVWDVDNSTPAGYWVNSDGIGRKWGDMNGDGKLTSADALMILQAAVGKIELG